MIKSPCRLCSKHELNFPDCFDDCERIKEIQRYDLKETHLINTTYVPDENHTFTGGVRRHHPAMS